MNPFIVFLLVYLTIGAILATRYILNPIWKAKYSGVVLLISWFLVAILWLPALIGAIRMIARKKNE